MSGYLLTNSSAEQNVFHIINLLLITQLSARLNERGFVSLLQPLWTLPCLIALRWWPGVMVDKWGTYALVTVLTSYPYARTTPILSVDLSADPVERT